MAKQTTDCILMVRPGNFRANEQTAVNNYFQHSSNASKEIYQIAQAEFDQAVACLQQIGVQVIVLQDEGTWDTPDSLFPNNVISFHGDTAILYPMFAHNRRQEIFLNHLETLAKHDLSFKTVKDYSEYAAQGMYLEGTGVLILDRQHQIAYVSLSQRASEKMVHMFCHGNGYLPILFQATQEVQGTRKPIYHTNVMMALGTSFCVICLKSIQNQSEQELVLHALKQTDKTIIEISEVQMEHFCGNILELRNNNNESFIVMSEQAYLAFEPQQLTELERFGRIIHSPLYTIEKYGGGSMRCMIAEVFASSAQ